MSRQHITILIVEDNQADIFLAEAALEELEAYEVSLLVAEDGETGLQALKKNEFDVAFIDYNLPKYDGPTILAKVSQEIRDKCFMLTTSDADENIAQSEKLQVSGYVTKPLNQAHFRNALNSVVQIALSSDVKFLHKKRQRS